MSRTSEIGLSRKQKVFAVLEDTMGTLKFPNATFDFIRPAGNAVLNQRPEYSDSEELADTLDILDQFQNACPAGDFTMKMYIRPSGTLGTASPPQGRALFESLQGSVAGAITAVLGSNISASKATLTLKTISGDFPQAGVVLIGTEKIYYASMATYVETPTTMTLCGCTRGYDGTTAATAATDAAVSLACLFYKQATTSPSFTLWVETDHIVQALIGCSVNQAAMEISNEGGAAITFTGQGMTMKWAGTDIAAHAYATAATAIIVSDAKRFCTGMPIYNFTTGAGRATISSINFTTNKLTLSGTIGATVASGSSVKGYLPTGTVIGDPLESRDAAAYLDGVLTKIRNCTLTIGAPKQYLTDEIGTEYPEDYLENVRGINTSLNLYFRKSAIKHFKDGYDNATNEAVVRLIFGDTQSEMMEVILPRCKLQVPELAFTPPAAELNIPVTALGTFGEDSCQIIFR